MLNETSCLGQCKCEERMGRCRRAVVWGSDKEVCANLANFLGKRKLRSQNAPLCAWVTVTGRHRAMNCPSIYPPSDSHLSLASPEGRGVLIDSHSETGYYILSDLQPHFTGCFVAGEVHRLPVRLLKACRVPGVATVQVYSIVLITFLYGVSPSANKPAALTRR